MQRLIEMQLFSKLTVCVDCCVINALIKVARVLLYLHVESQVGLGKGPLRISSCDSEVCQTYADRIYLCALVRI